MKVKTITCHHAINHGAMLQAYALATRLRMMGHDAEIIDYQPHYMQGVSLSQSSPRYDRYGLGWAYVLAKLPSRLKTMKRERVFDDFLCNYLPVTTAHYDNIDQLRQMPPEADVYIAGSDQIWNTTFPNGTDPAYYLDFGSKKTRRISYAASFAITSISNNKREWVKEHLHNFDAISVRESSAITLLHNLGHEGTQVVDPVFLLDEKQWLAMADETAVDEDFVLIYDFLNSPDIANVAKRISRLYGCKIYSIGPWPLDYANRNFRYSGPRTFITLASKARCVVSNSFHGSAFSIIFRRPFFVVERGDGLNTRMHDLLSHYNIPDRIVTTQATDAQLIADIDYDAVSDIVKDDINCSLDFLKRNL